MTCKHQKLNIFWLRKPPCCDLGGRIFCIQYSNVGLPLFIVRITKSNLAA